MHFSRFIPAALLGNLVLGSAVIDKRDNTDFSGTGNIFVVPGHDISQSSPSNIVGCITATGRFVADTSKCGVFTAPSGGAAGGLMSTAGKCTFTDKTAEEGKPMAPQGYAFKCSATPQDVYSVFYSLDAYNPGPGAAWIWQGNLNSYFEALKTPTGGEEIPIWYYTYGEDSNKVYFTWLWKKL